MTKSLKAVAIVAGSCAACSSSATIDTDPTVLGTTETAAVSCPASAPASASCTEVTVHCPRLDDANVVVIVSEPTSINATILLHDNVGGEAALDSGFVDAYHAAGFRVVQAMWRTDWEQSSVGIKHAACRYATLVDWIFAHVHASDRAHGYCAQSWGGGSGGLAFALADYGLGSELDAITISAGPPFSRIDLGCTQTSGTTSACPELPTVPTAYSDGPLSIISTWEVAPTCGTASPTPSELARWRADSLSSTDAPFAFPQTSLAAWYCVNGADATVGEGSLFFSNVTSDVSVHCVTGGSAGGSCNGQTPWPSALPDMVADMTARCVPRH